jgi:SnoaL-like domain
MGAVEQDAAALRAEVGRLVDRTEVQELLSEYLRAFEERRLDEAWARSIFTDDVEVEFPPGAHRGIDGIVTFHRPLMDLWDRTLHATSDHAIDVDGDHANLRAKLLATHVHRSDDPGELFHIGGRVDGEARRTEGGWRLRRVRLDLTWTQGDPPASG